MRQLSVGDYIVFIDDDDLVADDYISSILPLLDGVDQVGFQVQCYIDGKPLPQKTYHSLQYKEWSEDGNGYYRDISHINPMRWQIATIERIEGGHGEDKRWADRMRGKVKTEHYIDRVMYHYYFRTRKNMAGACINCQSTSTVIVEDGSFCNACGVLFNPVPKRRSCLWA
jgi:glycosyltransferase involved in cell wall biosynthesis